MPKNQQQTQNQCDVTNNTQVVRTTSRNLKKNIKQELL